ncbi:MAG: hypothetical protein OT477_19675 [Chloroflexi bacterium]|nr:hypothetical protein [Chloroflexota bacterium]
MLERFSGTRIVAKPAALDAAVWPSDSFALRLAADEVWVSAVVAPATVADPYAIVVPDEGWMGVWLGAAEAAEFLAHHCPWPLPSERPAFAQGQIAGLPLKLWLETERTLMLVAAPLAAELAERLGAG